MDGAVVISDDGCHPRQLLLVVFPLVSAIGGEGAVLLELNRRTICELRRGLLLPIKGSYWRDGTLLLINITV